VGRLRRLEHRLRRRLLAVDAPWLGMGLLLTEPCYSVGLRPPLEWSTFRYVNVHTRHDQI